MTRGVVEAGAKKKRKSLNLEDKGRRQVDQEGGGQGGTWGVRFGKGGGVGG